MFLDQACLLFGVYLYSMFRTVVNPDRSSYSIKLEDRILTLGSCFALNIGQKLKDYKFNVSVNPFGTLFNPISMFKLVNKAVRNDVFETAGIVENHGVYHHFDLHSELSRLSERELLDGANRMLERVMNDLQRTSLIIYTFGTAIVYELNDRGDIVANCHKVPANHFNRRFLDADEIVDAFRYNYEQIQRIKKPVHFILTVSPVRHQKESFEQNNVSKSILRIACERIIEQYDNVDYFPAFEIMMDELRDYRFYEEDMLHPNKVATDYIWQKFQAAYCDEELVGFITDWEKIRKAIAHRPFNKSSRQHQEFVKKTIRQVNEFREVVDVSPELRNLNAQLI